MSFIQNIINASILLLLWGQKGINHSHTCLEQAYIVILRDFYADK